MQIQQLKNNGRKFTLTPQVLLWSRCWDLILMFLSAYIWISARSNWFLLITNFDAWHITQLEIVLAAHFLVYAFHFCYHLTFFFFFFSSIQNICLKKYQIMKKQLDVVPRLLFYTCTFFSLLKSNSSTIIQLWFISLITDAEKSFKLEITIYYHCTFQWGLSDLIHLLLNR